MSCAGVEGQSEAGIRRAGCAVFHPVDGLRHVDGAADAGVERARAAGHSTVCLCHHRHRGVCLAAFFWRAGGSAAGPHPRVARTLRGHRHSPWRSPVGRSAQGWNPWLVLAVIQVFALCVTPTVSLSTTIAMSRLQNPKRQFGPIRAMGTIGWMVGCWIISAMNADVSTLAGFTGAGLWLVLAAFTCLLPNVAPPASIQHLTIRQRLGLDALSLLRKTDHRVVFLTATLFTIPLAAFYPYTPPHLQALGFEHASAWMSLAQTTEVVAMFTLGAMLTRWRLKWILGMGLGFGVLRYVFCALNEARLASGGGDSARRHLHSVLHHGTDLCERTHGSGLARPGSGIADAPAGGCGESHRLSWLRLVVHPEHQPGRH